MRLFGLAAIGFFYIVGHGIELGTIDRLMALSRAFFRAAIFQWAAS
jgi:isopenicillin N synthase-like dioxygenase